MTKPLDVPSPRHPSDTRPPLAAGRLRARRSALCVVSRFREGMRSVARRRRDGRAEIRCSQGIHLVKVVERGRSPTAPQRIGTATADDRAGSRRKPGPSRRGRRRTVERDRPRSKSTRGERPGEIRCRTAEFGMPTRPGDVLRRALLGHANATSAQADDVQPRGIANSPHEATIGSRLADGLREPVERHPVAAGTACSSVPDRRREAGRRGPGRCRSPRYRGRRQAIIV